MVLLNSRANVQSVPTFHFVLHISALCCDHKSASDFRIDKGDYKSLLMFVSTEESIQVTAILQLLYFTLPEGRAGIALEILGENRAG